MKKIITTLAVTTLLVTVPAAAEAQSDSQTMRNHHSRFFDKAKLIRCVKLGRHNPRPITVCVALRTGKIVRVTW